MYSKCLYLSYRSGLTMSVLNVEKVANHRRSRCSTGTSGTKVRYQVVSSPSGQMSVMGCFPRMRTHCRREISSHRVRTGLWEVMTTIARPPAGPFIGPFCSTGLSWEWLAMAIATGGAHDEGPDDRGSPFHRRSQSEHLSAFCVNFCALDSPHLLALASRRRMLGPRALASLDIRGKDGSRAGRPTGDSHRGVLAYRPSRPRSGGRTGA